MLQQTKVFSVECKYKQSITFNPQFSDFIPFRKFSVTQSSFHLDYPE